MLLGEGIPHDQADQEGRQQDRRLQRRQAEIQIICNIFCKQKGKKILTNSNQIIAKVLVVKGQPKDRGYSITV